MKQPPALKRLLDFDIGTAMAKEKARVQVLKVISTSTANLARKRKEWVDAIILSRDEPVECNMEMRMIDENSTS